MFTGGSTLDTDPNPPQPQFSAATYNLPPELAALMTGSTIPDLKITYSLSILSRPGWGVQAAGDAGLGLFLDATPSTSSGLFTGVDNASYVFGGAITWDQLNPPQQPSLGLGDLGYMGVLPLQVSLELINGVATTTIAGYNSFTYNATAADLLAWAGKTKFAAFHSGPGYNQEYAATRITNLTFFEAPEPASVGLLALGGLALIRRRRK